MISAMGRTHLCSVAEERWILVILFYRLGVEVNSSVPVMLRKSLVTLQLQRSGGLGFWGTHLRRTEGGKGGRSGGGDCRRWHSTRLAEGFLDRS